MEKEKLKLIRIHTLGIIASIFDIQIKIIKKDFLILLVRSFYLI